MEQLVVHCRGKVVLGRKAAARTKPNATVIGVGEMSAHGVLHEMMWQH